MTTVAAFIPTYTNELIDQLTAHGKAIEPLHIAAFRLPALPAADYRPGMVVWMYDHYNTATVVGTGRYAHTVRIESLDASGEPVRYDYTPDWLRPATEPHVFVWPR